MKGTVQTYTFLILSLLIMITATRSSSAACDVYFITYATRNGNTGHSALAVDNYIICVHDTTVNGILDHFYDTIRTGTLTYFDFWPEKDHFSLRNVGKDTKARYNRLPAASYDKDITLKSIVNEGIPHIKNYPCDGILLFETRPYEDYELIHFMDSIIKLDRPFNVRSYNCSDFVLSGASQVTGRKISAKEFIPFSFSTTPNRLFKKLSMMPGIRVIVDPGKKINGFFFKERILEILLTKKTVKKEH
jgi:hypothetical protein